jgi:transcriptional regulator with XRE-family HTH domain
MEIDKTFAIDAVLSIKHHLLRAKRQELGLTQKEAAQLIGIHEGTLSSYECLKVYPSPEIMDKICIIYKCPAEILFPTFLKNEHFSKQSKTKTVTIAIPQLIYSGMLALPEELKTEPIHSKILECLNKALPRLGRKEQKVVELYLGLHGHEPRTYEDIGLIFDVSRTRIQQIFQTAMRKLHYNHNFMDSMSEFLKEHEEIMQARDNLIGKQEDIEYTIENV